MTSLTKQSLKVFPREIAFTKSFKTFLQRRLYFERFSRTEFVFGGLGGRVGRARYRITSEA